MIDINRILCPVDLSEISRHALDHAFALAKWYDAHVTVLHVFGAVEPLVPLSGVPADAPSFRHLSRMRWPKTCVASAAR